MIIAAGAATPAVRMKAIDSIPTRHFCPAARAPMLRHRRNRSGRGPTARRYSCSNSRLFHVRRRRSAWRLPPSPANARPTRCVPTPPSRSTDGRQGRDRQGPGADRPRRARSSRSNGHLMRVRKLEIQPGGIVPWHSHDDRPALIYVVSGEIYEYASNCAVPILHKAGEVARETHATVALVEEPGQGAGRAAVVRHPARSQRPPTCDRRTSHRRSRPCQGALRALHDRPSPPSSPSSICSRRRPSCPRSPRAYGVTPAAMGFAVNASTIGMAVGGPRRRAVRPPHRSPARHPAEPRRCSSIPTALLATTPDLAAVHRCCASLQGLCMSTAFALTLAYLGEHCSAADTASAFAAYITGNVASNLFGRLLAARPGRSSRPRRQLLRLRRAQSRGRGAGLVQRRAHAADAADGHAARARRSRHGSAISRNPRAARRLRHRLPASCSPSSAPSPT